MAGENSIPKFFNPEMPPSPGGWHYWLAPDTKQFPIFGAGPVEVFEKLKDYLTNNAKFVSNEAIWRELWKYWCSLEPTRCGVLVAPNGVTVEMGKAVWGPILWKMLNLAAVNFSRPFFVALIQEMRGRLIPCPECRQHFEAIIAVRPFAGITDSRGACLWVHAVHNEVNVITGRPVYPYAQAMVEYGFPAA